jgi:preprotein translocase subunit YajC
MNLLFMLLQCTPQPANEGGAGGGGYQTILMFALLILVFYLFFIRPQTKKNKEMRKYREALQKGDKIITIGGIHGKISEVRETSFVIELIDKTRMEIEKSAVSNDPGHSKEQMEQRK